MSGSDLQLAIYDGVKLCHSMGMTLASPRDQSEYDNIKNLLKKTQHSWNRVFIEAYRSKNDKRIWLRGGDKVNYNINFEDNQPDNFRNVENCLTLMNCTGKMNDMPCYRSSQILCERSNVVKPLKVNRAELTKLMRPIAEYSYSTSNTTVSKKLYVSHAFLKASWIEARLLCMSLGMDLFSADSDFEAVSVQNDLGSNANLSSHFLTGITNMEQEHTWYSIQEGKALNYDIKFAQTSSSDEKNHCVMMEREGGTFVNKKISCTLLKTSFLCQETSSDPTFDETEPGPQPSFEFKWINEQSKNRNAHFINLISKQISFTAFPLQESKSDDDELIIKADAAICTYEQDLFDSHGNYVKTACQVSDILSHDDHCVDSGMNLFIIDSPETEKELLGFATSVFGYGLGSTLWINGKMDDNGTWFSYNPDKQALMDGITDITELTEVEKVTKYSSSNSTPVCLMISAFGPFKVDSQYCVTKMFSICEYRKIGKVYPIKPSTTQPVFPEDDDEEELILEDRLLKQ